MRFTLTEMFLATGLSAAGMVAGFETWSWVEEFGTLPVQEKNVAHLAWIGLFIGSLGGWPFVFNRKSRFDALVLYPLVSASLFGIFLLSLSPPSQGSIMMLASKWLVVGLALFQGAWMTFDGTRALVVGDYVTPSSGPGAGQLGPWSRVIMAVGLEPRSGLVKWLHIVLGIAWLASAAAFFLTPSPGWWAILGCAVGTLWYLPIGTVVAIVEIGLLLLLR